MCGIYLRIGTNNTFFLKKLDHFQKGIDVQMPTVLFHPARTESAFHNQDIDSFIFQLLQRFRQAPACIAGIKQFAAVRQLKKIVPSIFFVSPSRMRRTQRLDLTVPDAEPCSAGNGVQPVCVSIGKPELSGAICLGGKNKVRIIRLNILAYPAVGLRRKIQDVYKRQV